MQRKEMTSASIATALALASILLPTAAYAEPERQPLPTPVQVAQATVVTSQPSSAVVVETDGDYDSMNYRMFSSGAVTFLAAYAASAIVAGNSNTQGDNRLYVPVAGPWLDLSDRKDCGGVLAPCGNNETTYKVLLVADGIVQAAGVLGMIDGLFVPIHHHRETYALRPVAMDHASGLALTGSF